MKPTGGLLSSLSSAPLTYQMSAYCLKLLLLISAPTRQNSLVTQVDLRTATDPTAVTADIVAAASAQGTAHVTAAQAIDLPMPQSTGTHLVSSPGLSQDHITPAPTDR